MMNGEQVGVKQKPLVIIGVPCGDTMHSAMASCLWGIGRGSTDARQGFVIAQNSIIANGRNNLVATMISNKADYLLQIDSDLVFPPDTLNRLLAHGKDIVGATYVRRGPPFDNLGASIKSDMDKQSGLVEMTHIPTGMLLVKRKVYEAMKAPWFRYTDNEELGCVNGEDMVFSIRIREAGYKIFCDLDLSMELRHMYLYPLSPIDPSTRAVAETFKAAAAAQEKEALRG